MDNGALAGLRYTFPSDVRAAGLATGVVLPLE